MKTGKLAGKTIRKRCMAAGLLLMMAVGAGRAATINWTNSAGGAFSVAGNWNPNQVPAVNDLAELRTNAVYTITLDGVVTNNSLHVYNGTPTIDLSGNDYGLAKTNVATSTNIGFWVEKAYLRITNSAATPATFGTNDTNGVALYQPWNAAAGTVEFCGPNTRATLRSLRVNGSSPSNIPKHKFCVTGGARLTLGPGSQSSGGDLLFSGTGTVVTLQAIFLSGTGTGGGVGTTEVSDGATVAASDNVEIGRPGRAYVTVTGTGATLTAGAIVLATADTATYGSLTVTNGGTVTVSGAIWGPNTVSRDCDMLVVGSDSTAQAQDLYLSGSSRTASFTNSPFRLRIADSGLLSVTRYTTIWTNGTLTLDDGTFKPSTQGVINRGLVQGNGLLDRYNTNGIVAWTNYGTIQPGFTNGTFGTLIFTNSSLTIQSSGRVRFTLGGTAAGAYDTIVVRGNAVLGGTCEVSLAPGYTPVSGDSFRLLEWSGVSGTFNTLELPNIAPKTWITDKLSTEGVLAVDQPQRGIVVVIQ